jgi:hypothetical protein
MAPKPVLSDEVQKRCNLKTETQVYGITDSRRPKESIKPAALEGRVAAAIDIKPSVCVLLTGHLLRDEPTR